MRLMLRLNSANAEVLQMRITIALSVSRSIIIKNISLWIYSKKEALVMGSANSCAFPKSVVLSVAREIPKLVDLTKISTQR